VGLSVGCCSSGRHLPHVNDTEDEVLKVGGNICAGMSEGR
jgi:hypothetical protein